MADGRDLWAPPPPGQPPRRERPRVEQPAPIRQWAAPSLAVLAAVGTALYLRPANEAKLNLTAAVVVLAFPLLARWPLYYHQVGRAATCWTGLGLPGAYVLGSLILLAGGLTALVLLLDAGLLRRAHARAADPGPRRTI